MRMILIVSALALAFVSATAIACDDGDAGTSDGTTVQADPDPEPDPHAGLAQTVVPRPPDAVQVNVELREWQIVTDRVSAPAGSVYFSVDNAGPEDAHEFVVIRSDGGPTALPVVAGKVPEDAVDLIGEIEPFPVRTFAAITFDLGPGSYVLLCNIAEVEEGVLESHYELGMRTAFTVE